MRAGLLLAALLVAQPALADSSLPPARWANRQLPDPRQEARAEALMEELRCLVCQGQSIADSDAELAGDMRNLVRTRIAAGESPAVILFPMIPHSNGRTYKLEVRALDPGRHDNGPD